MHDPILLIDAYAQIFRGYYAMPPFTNSGGQPTGAVFAMAKFMLSLQNMPTGEDSRNQQLSESRLGAVVFDLGRPVHRLELAPEYKANRPPTPEDLKSQVPYIKDWIRASGWPLLEFEGLEADDIIAAIATHFTEHNIHIVSADKDLAQLINERVIMLIPDRKSGGLKIQGQEEVIQRFHVKPKQIVDYLSLIGDNSDNIPGVTGVGPKTAAKLINEFGSIDEMLLKVDRIHAINLREKIRRSAELLRKNRELIRLKTEIPESKWMQEAAITRQNPDFDKLRDIAEKLELHSLIKTIQQTENNGSRETNETKAENKPESQTGYTPDLF